MPWYPMKQTQRTAFTLIEMAIVLVIIGVLTGGVLAGKALIRSAQLRDIVSEFQHYQRALGSFREKYYALPGDMANAVSFWGAAAGASSDGLDLTCLALDGSAPSAGTATCNGDGNSLIGDSALTAHEMLRAWQQLANAKMIEGSYTGVPGLLNNQEVGENVPASRVGNAGWMLYGVGSFDGDTAFFPADYGNILNAGPLTGGLLTGAESFNIDSKIDDGNPQSGVVMGYRNAVQPDCVNADDDAYQLDNDVLGCIPIFITGF